jgi:hypothetical protein
MYLRIADDGVLDGGYTASVRGYESMSSEDEGTGPFPPLSLNPRYIPKVYSANVPQWIIVGDAKRFYFFNSILSSRGFCATFAGDVISYVPGDAYHFLLGAYYDSSGTNSSAYATPFWRQSNSTGITHASWAPRGWDQYPLAMAYSVTMPCLDFSSTGGTDSGMPLLVNPPDGRAWFTFPSYAHRASEEPKHIRGHYPGAWRFNMRITPEQLPVRTTLMYDGLPGYPDARPLLITLQQGGSSSPSYGAVDVNGPWL